MRNTSPKAERPKPGRPLPVARRTVVVVGAGIAGLAAARALSQAGFRAIVLERTAEPVHEGAGLQLSPNACHVLRVLGAFRAVAAVAFAPEAVVLRRGRDGRVLSRFALGEVIRERHGAPYLVVERAILRNALLGVCRADPDVDVRYGEGLADAALHRNGVTVLTERGREIVAAGLVGADGVHSAARRFVAEAALPEDTGWTAWRATAPADDDANVTTAWLGEAAHVVHYAMPNGDRLNVVAVLPDAAAPPLRRLAEWSPRLRERLAAAEGWAPWAIRTVGRGRWVHRAVALIGDAAHAMPPYAAQGAAMALEDAAVLADCARADPDDMPAAWDAFARRRWPRVRMIGELTAANRRVYHIGGALARARDLAMRAAPQVVLQRRMDAIYGWMPPI